MATELIRVAQAEVDRFMPVMTMDNALERRQIILEATKKLMKDGLDFGVIPGTGTKPTLLQPGADKLCNLFGITVRYKFLKQVEDWTGKDHSGEPFFYYKIKGIAYRGEIPMGEGIASCSSWESKYRWRKGERKCPACGSAAIIKGKKEYGGGYLCFAKKGGCGAKYKDGDQSIESQDVSRVPNPDIFDQVNTIQKMAVKRAKIATTINATSASEFFTQDVEDFHAAEAAPAVEEEPEHRPAHQAPPPPPATPEVHPRIASAYEAVDSGKRDAVIEEFASCKASILSLVESTDPYYEILRRHKMEHANELQGRTRGQMKLILRELVEYILKCQKSVGPPDVFEATDADIPTAVGGTHEHDRPSFNREAHRG